MPKKDGKKTATPPPRLISGGCKRSPIEKGSDEPYSLDTIQKKADLELPAQTNTIQGSPVRQVPPWFDNMQSLPRSRSSSPEMETTPRPLRVLKARKSLLQFDFQASARAATPTPPTVQPPDYLAKVAGPNIFGNSAPPKRSFLGLKRSSSTTKVIAPHVVPSSHIQMTGWGLHSPDVHLSRGNYWKESLNSKTNLSRQITRSSGSTAESSISFMALPSMSKLINWKQRSSSDCTRMKTRSLFIKGEPARVVQMIHPTITYESVHHVESIAGPLDNITPTKRLWHATSAGPGNLPPELIYPGQSKIRPLTPRPITQTNIELPKNFQEKPGVLSRVLCSMPDMSPLNGNRQRAIHVTNEDTQVRGGVMQGDISYREAKGKSLTEHTSLQSSNKSKGGSRSRGALGSIRSRFGSGSVGKKLLKEHIGSTALQASKKAWAPPPILRAQLDIHSESTREHVEGGREIWVCIEVEGRVNLRGCTEDTYEGSHKSMDIAIILDLSAYASPATFEETKSMAKHIINSLTPIDTIALTAFTSIQSVPGVETRHPSARLIPNNKHRLLSFIDGLFGQAQRLGTVRRDIKAIILAAVEDLKEEMKTSEADRTSHVFLLTSSVRTGDIPTAAECLEKQIKVHIFGVGPLVTSQGRPWNGGWIINWGSPAVNGGIVRQGSSDIGYKTIPDLPVILDSLRDEMRFGELTNFQVEMSPCEGCNIVDTIGDTTFDRLVPGEKRSILVKLWISPYNHTSVLGSLANTPDKTKDNATSSTPLLLCAYGECGTQDGDGGESVIPEYKRLERQLAATLGDIETRALDVTITYQHEYFGAESLISTRKTLKIQRFDGDGNWSTKHLKFTMSSRNSLDTEDDSLGNSMNPLLTPESYANDEGSDGEVEYIRTMLAKKVAEMTIGEAEENPRKALKALEEWCIRGKGVHAIASELEWRVKIQDEEKETERTMKGLTVEFQDLIDCIKQDAQLNHGKDISNNALALSRKNKVTLDINSNSAVWKGRGIPVPDQLEAKEKRKTVDKLTSIGIRSKVSSVIIHPPVSSEEHSSLDNLEEEGSESVSYDLHSHGPESDMEVQPAESRYDNDDEAERIWRELTETRMGLRRDVLPSRYRTPTLPSLSKHSKHNNGDFFRERHDKERKADVDWSFHTPSGVKDKQKERRRRIRKQAIKKRVMNADGGLRAGLIRNQNINVESYNEKISELPMPKLMRVEEVLKAAGVSDVSPVFQETESPFSSSTSGTSEGPEIELNYQSRIRDTMESLVTLRNVKETDFSPWAY